MNASFRRILAIVVLTVFSCTGMSSSSGQTKSASAVDSLDLSSELPRIPGKTPAEALEAFDVREGFRIELVAAEPLVMDPVAFSFDAYGRLFVVEMRDYSERATENLGRIARLEDTDSDGRMDKRTTFAEGLSWPTALFVWKDSVLVAAPPFLTIFRDANDDGISDSKEVLSEGFSRANVQGMTNSLRWTVEGFIHGATSSSGAEISTQLAGNNAGDAPLILRGRDFQFDPLSRTLRPAAGGGQHGMSFNRWGDKFATSNSDHLQQILDLESWLGSQKTVVPVPSLRRTIAEDGPQAEVYRTSPVEPWRIVRTRLRMSGQVPGVVEGGGRAAGYFTGATGTWIMDREAMMGDPKFDTAFVCDVGSNLVHRKRLVPQGLFWTGQRIDKETEFVRSSDIWFRPVQLGDGPDGGLYIADMVREVIEHPLSLAPVIKRHLDLNSGNDRGRIWRVMPTGQGSTNVNWSPGKLSNQDLVRRLEDPISWQRRMASQLLVERQAADVASELNQTALNSPNPAARILALHVLNRVGKLSPLTIKSAIGDKHPRVQEHAIRLARVTGCATEVLHALRTAVATSDVHGQLEMAMAAASLEPTAKIELLRELLPKSDDPVIRAVIAIAAGNDSSKLLDPRGSQQPLSGSALGSWLSVLLPAWVQQQSTAGSDSPAQHKIAEVATAGLTSSNSSVQNAWLDALCNLPSARSAESLLATIGEARSRELKANIERQLNESLKSLSESKPSSEAIGKLAWLRLVSPEFRSQVAEQVLSVSFSEAAQSSVAESLLWADPRLATVELLSRAQGMTPAVQQQVLLKMLRYNQVLSSVAEAIEQKKIATSQIAPDVRRRLMSVPDEKLRARFTKLLDTASPDRQKVIEQYRGRLVADAIANSEAAARGKESFQRVCASCHRLADLGNDVGPPLKQLSEKSPEQLLDTILDPNREVDPRFLGYTVLTADGRVLAGIIQDESASQIVLAESGGKKHTIPRSEIEKLQSTKLSLMPVGLEQQITPEQMSDLIAFLKVANR